MKPPILARALVAAVTSPDDYDSVAGDLHEEYSWRVGSEGAARANRWYWSQSLRSVPSLLSYARLQPSVFRPIGTAAAIGLTIVAMLLVNELLDTMIHVRFSAAGGWSKWPFFVVGWLDAAFFGALLSGFFQRQGTRLAVFASIAFLGFIALPIALGISSPLHATVWLLVLGAAPAMICGGALYHVVRARLF